MDHPELQVCTLYISVCLYVCLSVCFYVSVLLDLQERGF